MAASNNKVNGQGTGHYTNKKNADDWLFQGNTTPEIYYEDSFEADISALDEANDSGYFSSENIESSIDITDDDKSKVSYVWSADGLEGDHFSTDAAASTKANHGSIYDGVRNESTTTLEKGTSSPGQTLKSPRARLYDDFEDLSLPTYSDYSDYILNTAPLTLQKWVQTPERHESIAYRLEQPAKRRRTSSGRQ
jgi:hypothetical protein